MKIINPFTDGQVKGDIVELNDRRAKSELAHGSVEPYTPPVKKREKKPVQNKMKKATYKNKAYKK